MKRKLVSVLLAVSLAVSLLSGCAGNSETTQEPNLNDDAKEASEEITEEAEADTQADSDYGVINFDEDPYTLNVPVITLGDVPADLQMVQDKANEYLLDKINVQISMEVIGASDLTNTYMLKASSGDKLDLISMLPCNTMILPLVSSKMVMPVDDLLEEWGQGIKEDAGEMLKTGNISGKQYMIPDFEAARVTKGSIEFNAELVKKYNLEDKIKEIKTISDLEPLLKEIQENEPNVIPLTSASPTSFTYFWGGYDNLGDSFGVLEYGVGEEYEVVDWYETQTYMDRCKLMRDWFQKGFISKDILTSQDSGQAQIQAGKAFACLSSYAPNQDYGFDLDNPVEGCVEWPLADSNPVITTSGLTATGWAISSNCERPDKAMQFLNLLYTDPTLCTLLQRGIEGVHYTVTSDNLLDIVSSSESGYYLMFGQFGDESLISPSKDMGADYTERLNEYITENTYSPAFGFIFDSSEYATEIASCNAVVTEFEGAIECGSVDPEEEIPKFVEKLKAAGLDTLIAAKQKQLDEWVATQNK